MKEHHHSAEHTHPAKHEMHKTHEPSERQRDTEHDVHARHAEHEKEGKHDHHKHHAHMVADFKKRHFRCSLIVRDSPAITSGLIPIASGRAIEALASYRHQSDPVKSFAWR